MWPLQDSRRHRWIASGNFLRSLYFLTSWKLVMLSLPFILLVHPTMLKALFPSVTSILIWNT
jgi:hypothetical protein